MAENKLETQIVYVYHDANTDDIEVFATEDAANRHAVQNYPVKDEASDFVEILTRLVRQ